VRHSLLVLPALFRPSSRNGVALLGAVGQQLTGAACAGGGGVVAL